MYKKVLEAEAQGAKAWRLGLGEWDCPWRDDSGHPTSIEDWWRSPAALRQAWLRGMRQARQGEIWANHSESRE
jgi:hypothetical protein